MERTCPACRQPVPFEQVGEYCSVCGFKMSGPAGLPGGGVRGVDLRTVARRQRLRTGGARAGSVSLSQVWLQSHWQYQRHLSRVRDASGGPCQWIRGRVTARCWLWAPIP
jgi:hypothetical protein